MARKSTERLIDDAATALREYHAGGQHDPDYLRAAAKAVVELRSRFTRDKDGFPDWSGRTKPYRDAAAEVYRRAGFKPGEAEGWQRKLGYYVRLALDARDLPAAELEAVGIQPLNPKTRQTLKRTEDAALSAAFMPDTNAATRVHLAERLLVQAAAADLAELPAPHRAVIRISLDGIDAAASNLRDAVEEADAG